MVHSVGLTSSNRWAGGPSVMRNYGLHTSYFAVLRSRTQALSIILPFLRESSSTFMHALCICMCMCEDAPVSFIVKLR